MSTLRRTSRIEAVNFHEDQKQLPRLYDLEYEIETEKVTLSAVGDPAVHMSVESFDKIISEYLLLTRRTRESLPQ